ncbi:MAG: hypothetical protein RLZ37_10 [Actinomycetota bacterium]
MNDKIRRFTTQLSEAAPLAPELEGRTIPERRSPLTATRIGLAVATVAILGAVAVMVNGGEDRQSVIPASGNTDATGVLSGAIEASLPAGFRLMVVERRDNTGHAVAVNDRLEVLDIEINVAPTEEEVASDSVPTASVEGLITDTTAVHCIAPVSTPDASECLQYSNEATGTMIAPTTYTLDGSQVEPNCVIFEYTGGANDTPTAKLPCTLQQIENGEIPIDAECTFYVRSDADAPPPPPGCDRIAMILDETLDSTVPSVGSSPDTGPAVGESGSETPTTFTQWTGEESFMDDAFGPDVNGVRSPFAHASTRNNGVFVGATLFAIDRMVDLPTFVDELSHNVVTIGDLRTVIDSLPEALAPVGMFAATPSQSTSPEARWTSRGVTTGSFSVVLGQDSEDGAVVVQMSFPGSLETSGNDGDIFWHATTIDGRVSIALFQRGDRDAMTDEDAVALTRKMAEGWVDESAYALASGGDMVTDTTVVYEAGQAAPHIENPVETTVWGGF